jgi:hypothetical protein
MSHKMQTLPEDAPMPAEVPKEKKKKRKKLKLIRSASPAGELTAHYMIRSS